MWDIDDEYIQFFSSDVYGFDDHEKSDDNGIDSDLETALYGQLHHEQVDHDSPSISFNGYAPKVTVKNEKNSTKTSESINLTYENNSISKKTKKVTSKVKLKEKSKKELQVVTCNPSPKKNKRKKKNLKSSINTLGDGPSSFQATVMAKDYEQPSFISKNHKRKRLKVNSKYDYALERRTCRLTVQKDVDIITISSDTEKESVHSSKLTKKKINNTAITLDSSINTDQSSDDLYNSYLNYEKDVEGKRNLLKKSNRKGGNERVKRNKFANKIEDVVEISSSGESAFHDQNQSLPTDILINVERGTNFGNRQKDIRTVSLKRKVQMLIVNKKKQLGQTLHQNRAISDASLINSSNKMHNTIVKSREMKKKRPHNKSGNTDLSIEELIKNFYDSDDGEEYEAEDVIRKMTGNWNVVEHDYSLSKSDKRRYFIANKISLRCIHCKEIGHTFKLCPKVKPKTRCYLCAEENHTAVRCRFSICPQCQLPGHRIKECPLTMKDLRERCKLCLMPGHIVDTCPDNWRRYYLTTKPGPLVQGYTEYVREYCYNCGAKGHLGHECSKPRMSPTVFPHSPYVVTYDQPFSPWLNSNNNQGSPTKGKKRKKKCKKVVQEKKKPVKTKNPKKLKKFCFINK